MTKIAILGAGQIGRAVYQILVDLRHDIGDGQWPLIIDSDQNNIAKIESYALASNSTFVIDLVTTDKLELVKILKEHRVTHVINALPFFLNEKVALVAAEAKCFYIDFTEDDLMADKVKDIFRDTGLTCVVKCGLAPGFINYIGYNLVSKIDVPDSLMISVGALPRTVSYDRYHPELSYNLTWSVDGLVNEYIRPCRIRKDGIVKEIVAVDEITKVILDGFEYEAAHTSGGVGSLVTDLTNVPNVHYMTLRYPGHYDYIHQVICNCNADFEKIRQVFLERFPFTNDDVIIVYADAKGKNNKGQLVRYHYFNKFYGVNGLTGIQATTASSGVAILELMLHEKIQGIVNHSDINLDMFMNTISFREYYKTK